MSDERIKKITKQINVNALRESKNQLNHFKNDGLEIVFKEDIEDLKLLSATRNEEKVTFEEYLKNENSK
ncbi:MAG: hypothetical protein QG567_1705 [Campylobacterota bacterium]|nr:hypothetical protein [Campylobacterota bacterium]